MNIVKVRMHKLRWVYIVISSVASLWLESKRHAWCQTPVEDSIHCQSSSSRTVVFRVVLYLSMASFANVAMSFQMMNRRKLAKKGLEFSLMVVGE